MRSSCSLLNLLAIGVTLGSLTLVWCRDNCRLLNLLAIGASVRFLPHLVRLLDGYNVFIVVTVGSLTLFWFIDSQAGVSLRRNGCRLLNLLAIGASVRFLTHLVRLLDGYNMFIGVTVGSRVFLHFLIVRKLLLTLELVSFVVITHLCLIPL